MRSENVSASPLSRLGDGLEGFVQEWDKISAKIPSYKNHLPLEEMLYLFCFIWMVLMMEDSQNNTKITLCRFIRQEEMKLLQLIFLKMPACEG